MILLFYCMTVRRKEAVPMAEQVRDIKDNLDPLAPLSYV